MNRQTPTRLRVGTAIILLIHGAARVGVRMVDDFGAALATWGLPAWSVARMDVGRRQT